MNNVVTKTLIVLQLVFSLFFMCFAGAVYTFQNGWRAKAQTAIEERDRFKTNFETEQRARADEASKAKVDIGKVEERAALAEAQVGQLQIDLKQAQASLASAEQQRDKFQADLLVAQDEANARITETNLARAEIKRLRDQLNDGIAQRRSLEDQNLDRQGKIDEGNDRAQALVKEVTRLRDRIRAMGENPDDVYVGTVPAAIEKVNGEVLKSQKNASRSQELVEISIGEDDNIVEKMRLIVYRDNKYICDIEITDVMPDKAVGRVLEETRNGSIERGDHVTTKL
jgi:chromosome segregation ATPase